MLREALSRAGAERVLQVLVAQTSGWNTSSKAALFDTALGRISVKSFGSDTAGYYRWKAEFHSFHRHSDTARAFLDSARVMLEALVARQPDDPRFHAGIGRIYAELGLEAEARREGERAVTLRPVSRDAVDGVGNRLNLARILAKISDADAAIDQLAYLFSVPSLVSVPLLRVDPTWDPLRGHPRFERLVRNP